MSPATKRKTVLGTNIRRLRLRKQPRWTTTKLAEASDVCRQTIEGLERGYPGQENPKLETLRAISAALGVRVQELFRQPRRRRCLRRAAASS